MRIASALDLLGGSMSQEKELNRVKAKIGDLVMTFARGQLASNQRFRGSELTDFVVSQDPIISRASPDRVFRKLRKDEKLDYKRVGPKRASLYEILWVSA
jgi:hypothetical protein